MHQSKTMKFACQPTRRAVGAGMRNLLLLLLLGPALACGPDEVWLSEKRKQAQEHYQQRELDQAYAVAIEMLDRAPDDSTARILLVRIEYYRQNTEAAEKHAQALLDSNPDHYGALLWLARIWSNQEAKVADAMQLIERALRIETRSTEAWYLKGILHERQGQLADAITAYQAAAADNRPALVHLRLAELYKRADLAAKAETHLKLAKVFGAKLPAE